MTRRQGHPRGDTTAYIRMQQMRQRLKEKGWQTYQIVLPPDGAALLVELKQPGESQSAVMYRALRNLRDHDLSKLSRAARRAALIAQMWAMSHDEKLSHQDIANRLNEAKEPTITHTGQWRAGTIGKLLNEFKRGKL